jgi:hypothetical protein
VGGGVVGGGEARLEEWRWGKVLRSTSSYGLASMGSRVEDVACADGAGVLAGVGELKRGVNSRSAEVDKEGAGVEVGVGWGS